jgi:hypothetical protein
MTTRGKGKQEKLVPLIRLRGARAQHEVEAAVGLKRGTLTQIEGGTMFPPDYNLCKEFDRELGLDPGTVWNECAPYRLRRFDSKLEEWHQQQVDAVRGWALDRDEDNLLTSLRRSATWMEGLTEQLSWALAQMLDGPHPGSPGAQPMADGQVYRLRPDLEVRFASLPVDLQREALEVAAALMLLALEKRSDPGGSKAHARAVAAAAERQTASTSDDEPAE